jgi:tetratricopeptide (TPR) repeat protein
MSRRLLAMPVVLLLVACGPESKKKPALLVDEPVQQYEMGIGFLRQGRPDRALPYLEMASATEPQNPLYAYGVGLALLGMKDYRRAEAAFLQVLDIDPFLTDAHNNLGIIYGELGDKQRARAQFERVLTDRRYPTPEVARYNLGALLLDAGSYQQAADHLGAAAELKPDNAEWRLRYALALSGLERWSGAAAEGARAAARRGRGAVPARARLPAAERPGRGPAVLRAGAGAGSGDGVGHGGGQAARVARRELRERASGGVARAARARGVSVGG